MVSIIFLIMIHSNRWYRSAGPQSRSVPRSDLGQVLGQGEGPGLVLGQILGQVLGLGVGPGLDLGQVLVVGQVLGQGVGQGLGLVLGLDQGLGLVGLGLGMGKGLGLGPEKASLLYDPWRKLSCLCSTA